MEQILSTAKGFKSTADEFAEILSKNHIPSDKDFEKVLCACRGIHCYEKINALSSKYQPLKVSSRTFYKILTWYVICVDDCQTFSTGGEENMLNRNTKLKTEINNWKNLINNFLPIVCDFNYQNLYNFKGIKFNQDFNSLAIMSCDYELLDFFIEHGAPINRLYYELDIYGGTLLHVMSSSPRPSIEIAEILLKSGLDAHAVDEKGFTAKQRLLGNKFYNKIEIGLLGYTKQDWEDVVRILT